LAARAAGELRQGGREGPRRRPLDKALIMADPAPARVRQVTSKDPLAPDPEPIDVPPPVGPEKPAPGVPGTSDPEPVGIPDPAPA
jgi:hypothetical protein